MAKVITIILVVTMVASAMVPMECTVIDKELERKVQEALDSVLAAAPPEEKDKTRDAAFNLIFIPASCITKTKDAGKEAEAVELTNAYKQATNQVLVAAPADKYKVMEETFKAISCPVA
ncbi:hypothetical protein QOZ80_5AG0385870 [Eleusine coracana subsp. coracana]|nr:hypothetical protein QOZ80_5AG0385870 [Eleusine coracana subsp. coracana]